MSVWCPVFYKYCAQISLAFFALCFDHLSILLLAIFLTDFDAIVGCVADFKTITKSSPTEFYEQVAICCTLISQNHVYLVKFQSEYAPSLRAYVVEFVFQQTFLIKFACLLRVNCVVFITQLTFRAKNPFCLYY